MARGSGRHGTGRVPRASRRQVTERLPVRVEDADGQARVGATVDVFIGGWRTERTKGAIEDEAEGPEATVAYAQHAVSGETGGNGVAALPPAREWAVEDSDGRFEGKPTGGFQPIDSELPPAIDPLDRPRETLATVVAGYEAAGHWFGAEQVRLATLLESTGEQPLTVTLSNQRLTARALTTDVETPNGRTAEGLQYGTVTVWRSVPTRTGVPDDRQYLTVEVTGTRQLARLSGRTPPTERGQQLYTDPSGESAFEASFPTIDALASYQPVAGVYGPPVDPEGPATPPALTEGSLSLLVDESGVTVPGPGGSGSSDGGRTREVEGPLVVDTSNGNTAAFARAMAYALAETDGPVGDGYAGPLYPHLRWTFREWDPTEQPDVPSTAAIAEFLSLYTTFGGTGGDAAARSGEYLAGLTGVGRGLEQAGDFIGTSATVLGVLNAGAGVAEVLSEDGFQPDNDIGEEVLLSPNETERFDVTWSFGGSDGRAAMTARLPIRFEADRVDYGVEGSWTSRLELLSPSGLDSFRQRVIDRIRLQGELVDRRTPRGGEGS